MQRWSKLAAALKCCYAKGALPQLGELLLYDNKIGDLGMVELSKCLAMASLKTLYVDDGPLGTEHPALRAACEARGIALP